MQSGWPWCFLLKERENSSWFYYGPMFTRQGWFNFGRDEMETLEPLLREHIFFKGLDEKFIQLLAGCSSNRLFEAGKYILRSGEEANEFYLIRKGLVAIEIDFTHKQPIVLQTIGEGEILGWSWLLPPYYWHFDARAQEGTRVIALDGRCIRDKCEENHTLAMSCSKDLQRSWKADLKQPGCSF